MTTDVKTRDVARDAARTGIREVTAIWWWFLILGILWTGLGMFVLSYRVGSLAVVAALGGVAFLFGGVAQLVVASRVRSWRWLIIVAGILGVVAGILTFVWPDVTRYIVSIFVAWYLFPHAAQAIRITRRVRDQKTKKWRTVTVYAVTSLTAVQARPAELAAYIRAGIEALHHIRDVSYAEDASEYAPPTRLVPWPACVTSPSVSCAAPAKPTSPKPYATTPATPPDRWRYSASHDPNRRAGIAKGPLEMDTTPLTGSLRHGSNQEAAPCPRRSLMNPRRLQPISNPLTTGNAHTARTMRARDHQRRGTGRYHSSVSDPTDRARTTRPAAIATIRLRTGPPMPPSEPSGPRTSR
jgi:uncharacterized membrane protein HdeD (DUF308 family)